MRRKNNLLCSIILLFVFIGLNFLNTPMHAQSSSSPYSRYGVGDINLRNNSQSFQMGGTNIALQNDTTPVFFINTANPASYSNMRLTTVELGANYTQIELQNSTSKQKINNAAFSNISIALPLFKKNWGLSFGLIPFSAVGYKVTDHQAIENIGDVNFLYSGSGGINQAYIGTGFKPFYNIPKLFLKSDKFKSLYSKNYSDNSAKSDSVLYADHRLIREILKRKKAIQEISLGVNASYLFGSIENTRQDIFPYASQHFNTEAKTTTRFNNMYFDYGAQYAYTIDTLKGRDLKENVKLLVAGNMALQTNIQAKIDSLSVTYYNNSAGYQVYRDTIENIENTKGIVTFPLSFGFGLGFKKGDKWTVAGDFAVQNWSRYKSFNQSQDLKNSMRVSLGVQWVPNAKKINGNYLQRVHYRLGVRYAQTALELKNTRLTETAVSAGFGFPVGRNYILQNFSMINIGVEYGSRGTISNGLIKENFLRATIGFTINDRWFVKPKID